MSDKPLTHPSEEELAAYALGDGGESVAAHLELCPACAGIVKQVRLASDSVARIPEDDVPVDTVQRIKALKRHGSHLSSSGQRVQMWYRNPLVIGIGVVVVAIVLYGFFAFAP